MEKKFFIYHQNNSGGYWHGPQRVFVEATSTDEADERAELAGVYFDGAKVGAGFFPKDFDASSDTPDSRDADLFLRDSPSSFLVGMPRDCECCGDRWYRAYEEGAYTWSEMMAEIDEMLEDGRDVVVVYSDGSMSRFE